MVSLHGALLALCLALGAVPASAATGSSTTSAAPAVSTICGDIIDNVNDGNWYFYASDAYDCLTSVPFNPAVAQRFLDYFNTTMQFQSTLAYLRNPPEGYQQPAVDIEQVLQQISANVTEGRYKYEYDFEADVMHLVYAMHDTHALLYSGVMSTFVFGSGTSIVSASVDGVQPPKVYVMDDVWQRLYFGSNISPIATINGEDVVEFLERLAAQNSAGTVEAHADWNQLMYSPVLSILESYDVFSGGVTFYPGSDLNITFENGTDPVDGSWIATYTVPFFSGPLTTGGDLYNFIVLGNLPANYYDVPLPLVFNLTAQDVDNSNSSDSLSNWYNVTFGAYPANPIVVQDNLQAGITDGIVTGYIVEDLSAAVLSIPSFDEAGNDIGTFSQAVINFVNNATDKGVKRVLIDLQGNLGGQPLLAFTTFSAFFPNIKPFAGSRRRSHPLANVVGNTTTTFWSNLPPTNSTKQVLEVNEWIVTDRIDAATGQNFSSWPQYYGPLAENGDDFSLVEQYDFTNIDFQGANFDEWYDPDYLAGVNVSDTPPFAASQIAILTDGACASTCTLFVEMMTHQAGVRTIVVGGQPKTGPMQAASGTRGARAYDADLLDSDFASTNLFSQGATTDQLPQLDPDTDTRDSGMMVTILGFNLRDQVRAAAGSPNVPLQFAYLAADCRIYFTLDNILNVTALWRDAIGAMWLDSGRCVANSTGYSSNGNGTPLPPPARPSTPFEFPSASSLLRTNNTSEMDFDDALSDGSVTTPRNSLRPCGGNNSPCDYGTQCLSVQYPCNKDSKTPMKQQLCVPTCENSVGQCPSSMWCDTTHTVSSEERVVKTSATKIRPRSFFTPKKLGKCVPSYGVIFPGLGCGI